MWKYNYTPDELYHWGVPGMKWGKRKAKVSFNDSNYRQSKIDKATAKIDRKIAKKQAKIDKKNAKIESAGGKKKYIAKKIGKGAGITAGVLAGGFGTVLAGSYALGKVTELGMLGFAKSMLEGAQMEFDR